MSNPSVEAIPYFLRLSSRIGTAGQPHIDQFAAIREAGYEVVVNLRPASDTPPDERALVEQIGMEYVHIPVFWDAPTAENIEQFFATMQTNKDKCVFVHCARNMRVSAFIYLYRIIKGNVAPEEAARDLHRIWQPNPIWQALIERTLRQYSASHSNSDESLLP
jgi:protein tyrosine phosphatase (PTP) superfamily phosphohydrolase (DUF442 family)